MVAPIVTKPCPGCKTDKPASDYFKNRGKKDGLSHFCKVCHTARGKTKEEQDAYLRRYWATPHGRAVTLWHAMNQRVKADQKGNECYVGIEVRVSRADFLAWLTPLLAAWFRDRPDETPSVDRIEAAGHYELSNMRVISLSDNAKQANVNAHAPAGTRWCPRCEQFLPVGQFDEVTPTKYRPAGLSGYCTPCGKADRRRRYLLRPDRKLRQRAYNAVYWAIIRGTLKKPEKCQHPGCDRTDLHGHHHKGYEEAHWLDVVWLCPKHHAEAEREATLPRRS